MTSTIAPNVPVAPLATRALRIATEASRRVLGFARATARLTAFVLLLVIISPLARVLRLVASATMSPPDRMHLGQWVLWHFCQVAGWIFGVEVETDGPVALPGAGSLIVANHHSYLDVVALGATAPALFLSKAEVSLWPLLGPAAEAAGVGFVRRDSPRSRAAAVDFILERLRAGLSVVVFPSGTTSRRGEVPPFRRGVFSGLVGSTDPRDALIPIVPATLTYESDDPVWIGDATFLPHLYRIASLPRVRVRVTFGRPLTAREIPDADALRDACYARVRAPQPAPHEEVPDSTTTTSSSSAAPARLDAYLKKPWLRQRTTRALMDRFSIRVVDQPGRWMDPSQLEALRADLARVAGGALAEVPTYGVFSSGSAAYENRVIAVAYERASGAPAAFTAMVYLPSPARGSRRAEPLLHLGLTMIAERFRGLRLQTALFRAAFALPLLNQRRLGFTITNIAASPAGIGATSDYFHEVYPHYGGATAQGEHHLAVARHVLAHFRHEFGCSEHARFDPDSFVVHGSNDPSGGGAHQFIKTDPVSRYRVDACNRFCRERLDLQAGDELFQVGRVHLLRGLRRSSAKARGVPTRTAAPPRTARDSAHPRRASAG